MSWGKGDTAWADAVRKGGGGDAGAKEGLPELTRDRAMLPVRKGTRRFAKEDMGQAMVAHLKDGVLRDVTRMRPAWNLVIAHSELEFGELSLDDWLRKVRSYCLGWIDGTRVRSVVRKASGIHVTLTQPAIVDPERTGAGRPVILSYAECKDFTYLEFKFTLVCEGNLRQLFVDFFDLIQHKPLVWRVVGDVARAVFLGPVEMVGALDVLTIEEKESGDKTDINVRRIDRRACFDCGALGHEARDCAKHWKAHKQHLHWKLPEVKKGEEEAKKSESVKTNVVDPRSKKARDEQNESRRNAPKSSFNGSAAVAHDGETKSKEANCATPKKSHIRAAKASAAQASAPMKDKTEQPNKESMNEVATNKAEDGKDAQMSQATSGGDDDDSVAHGGAEAGDWSDSDEDPTKESQEEVESIDADAEVTAELAKGLTNARKEAARMLNEDDQGSESDGGYTQEQEAMAAEEVERQQAEKARKNAAEKAGLNEAEVVSLSSEEEDAAPQVTVAKTFLEKQDGPKEKARRKKVTDVRERYFLVENRGGGHCGPETLLQYGQANKRTLEDQVLDEIWAQKGVK